jgi:L-lactate dehydrogenase complex protein LldG
MVGAAEAIMSDARSAILGTIRRSLRRDAIPPERAAALEARLGNPTPNLIPARAKGDARKVIELFVEMTAYAQATLTRVKDAKAVPAAVAEYLAGQNLPASFVMAPDPELDAIPWSERPTLSIRRGRTEGDDQVSVTGAFAAIAETGTLMLTSGPDHPSTLNFLPETHIVVLKAGKIVGPYEEAWNRLRAARDGTLPRTVNFVTGPSRSGDIEQRLLMGAHGPRRLHVVLIDD